MSLSTLFGNVFGGVKNAGGAAGKAEFGATNSFFLPADTFGNNLPGGVLKAIHTTVRKKKVATNNNQISVMQPKIFDSVPMELTNTTPNFAASSITTPDFSALYANLGGGGGETGNSTDSSSGSDGAVSGSSSGGGKKPTRLNFKALLAMGASIVGPRTLSFVRMTIFGKLFRY